MFKRKNNFYFFAYLRLKFFDCLIALPQHWDRAVIVRYLVLLTVVVCFTGIFNYNRDKLAIQRLLK